MISDTLQFHHSLAHIRTHWDRFLSHEHGSECARYLITCATNHISDMRVSWWYGHTLAHPTLQIEVETKWPPFRTGKGLEFHWKLFVRAPQYVSIGSGNGLAPTRWQALSRPMMVNLVTHICVTRPECVYEYISIMSMRTLANTACDHTPMVRVSTCFTHPYAYSRRALSFHENVVPLVNASVLCTRISTYLGGIFVSLGRHSRPSGICEAMHFTLGASLFYSWSISLFCLHVCSGNIRGSCNGVWFIHKYYNYYNCE